MRVDDDVARQANKDTESDKDEVELILDRDYVQVRGRRVRITYLGHFVPPLLLQDVTSGAQLALPRFQGGYRVRPLFPLGPPLAFQFALCPFQSLSSRGPSLFPLLLLPLSQTTKEPGTISTISIILRPRYKSGHPNLLTNSFYRNP